MDYSDSEGSTISLYLNPKVWNYGKSTGLDHTHIVSLNFLYDLPRASKLWNVAFMRGAFDHWELSGVASFIDGSPTGISYSLLNGADVTGGGDGSRVVMLANPILSSGQRTLTQYFNTAAFAAPSCGFDWKRAKGCFPRTGHQQLGPFVFQEFPDSGEVDPAIPVGDV